MTVNTSPTYGSSLADLKKQRCDQRSTTSVNTVGDVNGKSLQNGYSERGEVFGGVPPSPSVLPRKFHGDPLEVVGESKKKKGCCCLM